MAKNKKDASKGAELVAVEPVNTEMEVLPPTTGTVGNFLNDTANMFKARGMRMRGVLGRIDQSGQRTEALLRTAADCMEAAEAKLEHDLKKEGLLPETTDDGDEEE
ncbi:hypothetical protein ACFL2Q_00565 [Thermodesulfobacteriota bacterium]